MAYVVPVAGGPGQGVAGAAVVEEVVEPGSDFNLEVRALDRGDTGEYVVFDRNGVVVASSDEALVAEDLDAERLLRSEEHTSELQSLMRISYAVFCLKKKK